MLRLIIIVFALSCLTSCKHSGTTNELQSTRPHGDITNRHFADIQPKLTRELTPDKAEIVLGKPDRITGSGITIYVYALDNQQELWVGFTGKILYAFLTDENGRRTEIQLKDK